MLRSLPARLLCILALALAAAGCSPSMDADQARLCRIILPVLHPDGTALGVLHQKSLADDTGIRIDYTAREADHATHTHFLICGYAGPPPSRDIDALLDGLRSVRTDRKVFGGVGLFFLKRFWLATPEAAVSDPQPVVGVDRAGEVPEPVAYGLQQAVNALPLAAIYALLAAAYSLVYGLIGRINLAFGEFAAAGGYAAFFGVALVAKDRPIAALGLGALLAATTATLHGVMAGRFVFEPLRTATGQQALVATVGLSLFLSEYLRVTQGVNLIWLSPFFATPMAIVRSKDFVATVTPIALFVSGGAALIACALLAVMRHSRFGRSWRAYADDARAAELFGVDPKAIFAQTFAIASLMAGIAGYIMTIYYGSLGYGASTTLGLKALIAAILGGIGSVPGAFFGGIAIGAMEAVWSSLFPIAYRDLAIYSLLIALLIWRPGGFLGFGRLTPRQV